MKKLHILGSGCTKCNTLADLTRQAADELGINYELEKVTDFLKFADYGVMVTPALVIDGKLAVSGRVPALDELKNLLSA
ncbi:thioredoxin family protein [Sulfuriroseicoccus oceanibius]|uniref:TM0996/MTH895 family glutaredoxin-like protein n=1 Tax=Sulfuriroseicoccus oceanibius TaxID=2707525 RepID=A0A6B3LAX8_9BACT|nr:thioredoxin family protein [Sulfuriroseicoccus oceanibius]QQL46175.1 TM0996/MTH895 family glutaredoxin-like protein [Sulfuriroseicoccus oceanibius]